MQQQQHDFNVEKERRKLSRENSVAAQVKHYSDAVEQSIPSFPSDPAEISMFFDCVDKLFDQFEMPNNIRGRILVPSLSNHAKSLLFRLDQTGQNQYEIIRNFLLNEYKLTPIQFKDISRPITIVNFLSSPAV